MTVSPTSGSDSLTLLISSKSIIELYDYSEDRYETNNIASENPEIVKELLPILIAGDTGLYDSEL